MKKLFLTYLSIALLFAVITISCSTQEEEAKEPEKIENTLQSVSYFKDTIGLDPLLLKKQFTSVNEAIDEIGYPDAGYKIWINQSEESKIRFMVEGFWPDQETYDIIHEHELYKDAMIGDSTQWEGLESAKYFRFKKIK